VRTAVLSIALLLGSSVIPCAAQFLAPVPPEAPSTTPGFDGALLKSLMNVKEPVPTYRTDDVVNVIVFGLSAFNPNLRVEPDGTITFPFIGQVQVAGLTNEQLETSLTDKLKAAGIVQNPQVTVMPASQPWDVVTIAGDVQKPGMYPAVGNLDLLQYMVMAGGIMDNLSSSNLATNSPSSSVVTLVRTSIGHPVTIPLGPDPRNSPWAKIPLISGDEIEVGRVGQVYAVGAFRIQGAYALKNTAPTTLIQLMAQAGGIGFEGERGRTVVIRTEGLKQYLIKVNVNRILKGKETDISLQADDIVFVPTNQIKAAVKGGGTGALVAVADNAVLAYGK
jgi:polysaccharide biosynthesis/export protein